MTEHDHADHTEQALVGWAQSRPDIGAVILTSTRAVPHATLDAYSDYDVILVVDDVEAMVRESDWLTEFGEVLVAYWDPVEADAVTGALSVGNVTQYVNGLKIDFSLWSAQQLHKVGVAAGNLDELDAGYRVLVDKRELTSGIPAPTYSAYVWRRPDQGTFLRLVTDFFIGPPYVAKSLLRGQLLPAKWVLDFDMRYNYFVPMLEWRVECDYEWSWKPGSLGKGLHAHLPPDLWAAFEATFTGPEEQANWEALFAMMALFGQVARDVAAALGYDYPDELEDRVVLHVRRMRDGAFARGPV